MKIKRTKISVIGAGFVGCAISYALMQAGLTSELVLVDVNKEKAEGEAMDLAHGVPFVRSMEVYAGDYPATKGSDIVIITAGVAQKPGETRLNLIQRNLDIFKTIVPPVVKYSPNCILLVVSNPVDILTYITYKLSGFKPGRVLGSGTVLDTARLRQTLGLAFGLDPRNIHSYIIGEHGDSEITAWSLTTVAGMNVYDYCRQIKHANPETFKAQVSDTVRNAAYEIINRKGYTNYAIGLAVRRIVETIMRDERSILTVSVMMDGLYSIDDVYIAMPTVVGRNGAEKVLHVPLSAEEVIKLRESAMILKEVLAGAKL